MSRKEMIERTLRSLERMPETKLKEVADFTEKVLSKAERASLVHEVMQANEKSSAFAFLEDEPDLYSLADIKPLKR